ncbi:hypothetical protein PV325_010409 [Microctonus aethiopoides]|uniref:Uncharacterized protein n=1 Tax=Microctonus aethiopoides TaxID=144406 RepID=A0AA39C3G0_9HYME|nr:hypothetical protein PV325_010409 [Microctonus aethiopoides]KAK0157178.1 hypothetical protein PV328_011784 [Microctonus aethiopoides]
MVIDHSRRKKQFQQDDKIQSYQEGLKRRFTMTDFLTQVFHEHEVHVDSTLSGDSEPTARMEEAEMVDLIDPAELPTADTAQPMQPTPMNPNTPVTHYELSFVEGEFQFHEIP